MELSRIHKLYPAISTKPFVFIVQEKMGLLKNLGPEIEVNPASNAIPQALSVSREEVVDYFMSEMKRAPGTPPIVTKNSAKRVAERSASPSSAVVSAVKKGKLDGRPALLGRHPCHKWILGLAPCKGQMCGQDPRRRKPHGFAECDKGSAANEFSAWVKGNAS
jgi:hypothetical protein